MCVQNLDDSRGPAIRITYRISLRSSSLWEPRHPSLKVVLSFCFERWVRGTNPPNLDLLFSSVISLVYVLGGLSCKFPIYSMTEQIKSSHPRQLLSTSVDPIKLTTKWIFEQIWQRYLQAPTSRWLILDRCVNDPSAGSPTETLLRLHLPLNDKV